MLKTAASPAPPSRQRRRAAEVKPPDPSEHILRPGARSWLAADTFALALFAFLAAVYLAHAATNEDLRETFRRRALGAAGAVFVLAIVALVASYREAPRIARGVAASPWALPQWPVMVVGGVCWGCASCLWKEPSRY